MGDPRTDEIAREAARLIESGRLSDIDAAIRRAVEIVGHPHATLPSRSRVRRHAQAMSMQALGEDRYNDLKRRLWTAAEEVMTTLEHALPDSRTLLVGRAAQGHLDAGVIVHIRIATEASVTEIAQHLVDFGYDEPGFRTAESLHGRLNQICWTENGFEIVLTRCPTSLESNAPLDLFTGKPIDVLSLIQLRRLIADAETRSS